MGNKLRVSGLIFAGAFLAGYVVNIILDIAEGKTLVFMLFNKVQLLSLFTALIFTISALNMRLYWIQPTVFLATAPLTVVPEPYTLFGLGYFIMGVLLLERTGFFSRYRRVKVGAVLSYLMIIEVVAAIWNKGNILDALGPTFFIAAFGLFLWFLYKDRLVVYLREPKPTLSLTEKGLSPAEKIYVLSLIEGRAAKEICLDYEVAESTVRNSLSRAYKKLGVEGHPELMSLAGKYEVVA